MNDLIGNVNNAVESCLSEGLYNATLQYDNNKNIHSTSIDRSKLYSLYKINFVSDARDNTTNCNINRSPLCCWLVILCERPS